MSPVSDLPRKLSTTRTISVLMVCTGNICRSPMAASILRRSAAAGPLAGRVIVDSAGTYSYHIGEPADRRARTTLAEAGYDTEHTARMVRPQWLADRTLVLAMDAGHLRELRSIAVKEGLDQSNLRMLRDFDPEGPGDVPDPYYDTLVEFRDVRRIIERCMPALLEELGKL